MVIDTLAVAALPCAVVTLKKRVAPVNDIILTGVMICALAAVFAAVDEIVLTVAATTVVPVPPAPVKSAYWTAVAAVRSVDAL